MAKIIPFRRPVKKRGHTKAPSSGRETGFQSQESIGQLLQQLFKDPRFLEQAAEQVKSAVQVELEESESEIRLRLPMPPIDRSSLSLTMTGAQIQISAVASGMGRISQVLPIVLPVTSQGAKAYFQKGLLEICLQKKEAPEASISIPIFDS